MNPSNQINTPKIEDNLERIIGAAAVALHITGSEELICEIPNAIGAPQTSTDYELTNGVIRFFSVESRNRIVAAHRLRENQTNLGSDPSGWLKVVYELWCKEIGRQDTASGRLLALIHEKHDIFDLSVQWIRGDTLNVFFILGMLESAFPYLSTLPPDGIWRVCEAQHEMTKRDMAGGVFFTALRRALVKDPDVCRTIHSRLTLEITEASANLHLTSIMALAESSAQNAIQLTFGDIHSSNTLLASAGQWTLGQLIISSKADEASMSEACAVIIENLSSPHQTISQAAKRVAAIASTVTDCFLSELQHLAIKNDAFAIAAIVEALWRHFEQFKSKNFFQDWVKIASKTVPDFTGTLEQFDHVLSRLLSDESEQQFALSCLTEWVELNGSTSPRNDSFSELFNLTTLKLMEQRELFQQLFTEWLLADGMRLPSAASGLLSYASLHGFEKPEFNIGNLETLTETDLLFLARRLIGFIYSEQNLISLAMSLFKIRDVKSRTLSLLRSLIVDEVGYDYPDSMIQELELFVDDATDSDLKSFGLSAIEAIQTRLAAVSSLPLLKELQPPTALQRQLFKARAKQMNKAMKAARENSLIRELATEIPVKGGKGYFSFHDGTYTEPSYFKSFSHSMTLPWRVVVDEVGYEIHLLMLRNAKRGDS